MNIMYFLPSIPLLVLSSWLDGIMDRRFGASFPLPPVAFPVPCFADKSWGGSRSCKLLIEIGEGDPVTWQMASSGYRAIPQPVILQTRGNFSDTNANSVPILFYLPVSERLRKYLEF